MAKDFNLLNEVECYSKCNCTSECWGNGECNPYLNTLERCWDGGDCFNDRTPYKCIEDQYEQAEFCRKMACDCNKRYLSYKCEVCCPPSTGTTKSTETTKSTVTTGPLITSNPIIPPSQCGMKYLKSSTYFIKQ